MTEAQEAARLWSATLTRPLRLRENEVHEVALPSGRAALRLHRVGYQTAAAIRSELWWCGALRGAGLPVSGPIALPDGSLVAQLSTGRYASVVTWVDGAPLGEAGVPLDGTPSAQAARHHALGQLLAEVHRATDALTLPQDFMRPSWDRDALVGETPQWGRFWDHPALTPTDRATLVAARAYLSQRLAASASPKGLIHADVLRENVFVDGPRTSLIDFDDSGFGYRWFDLGTVLSQCLAEPAYPGIRAALIEGYATVCAVDPAEVDAFTLARTLASVGWAATRLPKGSPVHASHIARAVRFARTCMR